MKTRSQNGRRGLVLLLLVLAAVLPHGGALNHEYVYDDFGQVAENEYLAQPANIVPVLLGGTLRDADIINGRRPVVLLLNFADRALVAHPWTSRILSLLLHAANVLLLYGLILRIGGERPGARWSAFVSALLFAIHPMRIEAVHALAFRADVLFTFFVLLYVLLGVGLTVSRHLRCRVALLALALLAALGSKEAGVVAPAVLAAVWWLFPNTRPSHRWMGTVLALSGLVAVVFLGVVLTAEDVQAISGSWNGQSLFFPQNLLTLPWLWITDLRLLCWPWPMVVDRVVMPVASMLDLRFVFGVVVLLDSVLLAFWFRKRAPRYTLALCWMLLGFLPVANIVPLWNPLAERYLYFMLPGFSLVVGTLLTLPPHRSKPVRITRQVSLALLCCLYVMLSIVRLQDWTDSETLWRRTLNDEPRSTRALTWLGLHMQDQNRLDEALDCFNRAVAINPQDANAWINRGILLGKAGALPDAEASLLEACRRRPDKAEGHWNLAVVYQLQGRYPDALGCIQKTLALEPRHRPALRGGVAMLTALDRKEQARQLVDYWLTLDPDNPEALSARDYLVRSASSNDTQNP